MDFQEWLEQPCDEEVVCACEYCNDVIYEGEECIVLEVSNEMFHIDCYCPFVKDLLKPIRIIASNN